MIVLFSEVKAVYFVVELKLLPLLDLLLVMVL
jgi:hypothetical protein